MDDLESCVKLAGSCIILVGNPCMMAPFHKVGRFKPLKLNYINVREYRKGNQKWTIQKNWQHRVHKTKDNKKRTQHNMYWTPLYSKKKHKQRKQDINN